MKFCLDFFAGPALLAGICCQRSIYKFGCKSVDCNSFRIALVGQTSRFERVLILFQIIFRSFLSCVAMTSKCMFIFVSLLLVLQMHQHSSEVDAAEGFQLVPGIEIVPSPMNNASNDAGSGSRSSPAVGYIDRVFDYLQGHELKINLHDLMKKTEFSAALSRTFKEIDADNEIGGNAVVFILMDSKFLNIFL